MYGRPLDKTFCKSAPELRKKLPNDIRSCVNPSLLDVNLRFILIKIMILAGNNFYFIFIIVLLSIFIS